MIEGISVVFFKKSANFYSGQTIRENPNQKIIESFKAKVLKNLTLKSSNSLQVELTSANQAAINSSKFQTVVSKLYLYTPSIEKEGATLHGYNTVSVFSLPEIPEWIFKVGKENNDLIVRRFNDTENALNVIKDCNLNFLHAPRQIMLDIEVTNRRGRKKSCKSACRTKIQYFNELGRGFISILLR